MHQRNRFCFHSVSISLDSLNRDIRVYFNLVGSIVIKIKTKSLIYESYKVHFIFSFLFSHFFSFLFCHLFTDFWCVFLANCQFTNIWTVAHQSPLSMEFFRQEYWNGLPFLSPGESSPSRDQTCLSCVSCIPGEFFMCWVIREVPNIWKST